MVLMLGLGKRLGFRAKIFCMNFELGQVLGYDYGSGTVYVNVKLSDIRQVCFVAI